MSGGAIVGPKEGSHREKATVLHRFHFTSALKRMAVTVKASPLPCMLRMPMHLLPASLAPALLPPSTQCPVALLSLVTRLSALCLAGCVSPWGAPGFLDAMGRAVIDSLQGLLMPASACGCISPLVLVTVPVMQVEGGSSAGPEYYALLKGAPEVVEGFLERAPGGGFARCYRQYASQGGR